MRGSQATCSPGAQGLYFRLKMIASNAERYGILIEGGKPIPAEKMALKCQFSREDFDRFFGELGAVGVPCKNSEGLYYFPEMVESEAEREAWRLKKKKQRRRKNVPKMSPPMSLDCPIEDESESVVSRKTPAVKDNETTALVPGERRVDPVSRLVMAWKTGLLGIPKEDTVWNRRHWGRCAAAAKDLLTICDGNIEESAECMAQKHAEFTKAGLNFTLETIVKHAHEWRHKNGLAKSA